MTGHYCVLALLQQVAVFWRLRLWGLTSLISGHASLPAVRPTPAKPTTGEDIVYSSLFTGVHGNYLKSSVKAAGLDPDNLPEADKSAMNFGSGGNTDAKAWKDIWGSGQGVGSIHNAPTVQEIVDQLKSEYNDAKARLVG